MVLGGLKLLMREVPMYMQFMEGGGCTDGADAIYGGESAGLGVLEHLPY